MLSTVITPENPEVQERAEIIRHLVEADEYINTSTVTKEQLEKTW